MKMISMLFLLFVITVGCKKNEFVAAGDGEGIQDSTEPTENEFGEGVPGSQFPSDESDSGTSGSGSVADGPDALASGSGSGESSGDTAEGSGDSINPLDSTPVDDSTNSETYLNIDTNTPLADEDIQAINDCLDVWGASSPFVKGGNYKIKVLAPAVTVFGFGTSINDQEQTSVDQLILIGAGVAVGSAPQYNMLNEKGWYCLKADVNVRSNKTITLGCQTRVVDSKVNVNINSSGGSGGVGVNVGSNVTVNRRPGC